MTKAETHASNRERILAVAKDLFTRHDYDAVTVRLVAHCANLSTGAIFSAFKDKAELHFAAMGYDHEILASASLQLFRSLGEMLDWFGGVDPDDVEGNAVLDRAIDALNVARAAFPVPDPSPLPPPAQGDGVETAAPSAVSTTLPEGAFR